MAFVNNDIQRAFFQTLRRRRDKRTSYGAEVHPNLAGPLFFDRCLDMISCHDPDIWSRGTGNLLVAPLKERCASSSTTRAEYWRHEASRDHYFLREFQNIDEESFGYFARRTIEYRDRMRNFKYEREERNEIFSDEDLELFDYLESMTHQLEDFSLQADLSRRLGIRRFGLLFDNDRDASKNYSDFRIYDEIHESISNPVIEALREFLIDTDQEHLIYEDNEDNEEYDYPCNDKFFNLVCELQISTGECVVCYQEGDVLELRCHPSHIVCDQCISKIIRRGSLCPMCRQHMFLCTM
jgi:hypothetical protein